MSFKAVAWTLLATMALALVLLFNYWASYQPLSTVAYAGIVLALLGLVNLALPFRFLGIRKRAIGAIVLAGGVVLAVTALLWPAPTIRVAQHRTRLDDVMPEYQFNDRHSERIHAKPEQVMQAIRESTFGDMKCLTMLLKIRGAALRIHDTSRRSQDMRIVDAFSASGYVFGGSEHEILMCGGANLRAKQVRCPISKLLRRAEAKSYRPLSRFSMVVSRPRAISCSVIIPTSRLPSSMSEIWPRFMSKLTAISV